MKKHALIISMAFFVSFSTGTGFAIESPVRPMPLVKKASRVTNATITILFDNNYFAHGLKTANGFSCLVETKDKKILFDTGEWGGMLLDNFEKMRKDPKTIDVVVISHVHSDHTGGLQAVLDQGITPKVYIPESLHYERIVRKQASEVVRVGTAPMEISRGVYSTGEMIGGGGEQALLINTDKGVIVITGCAHPGIVGVVKRAKEVFNRSIYLVMGGFHLLNEDVDTLREIAADFKKLGVQQVAPCHCSGKPTVFRNEFKEHFVECGVGTVMQIDVNKSRAQRREERFSLNNVNSKTI